MSEVTSGICRINNEHAKSMHNGLVQQLARYDGTKLKQFSSHQRNLHFPFSSPPPTSSITPLTARDLFQFV